MALSQWILPFRRDATTMLHEVLAETAFNNSENLGSLANMKQPISDYHQDDEQDWVARLGCGHFQHVRHNPPWTNRPWVISKAGRDSQLGVRLECKKCDAGEPPDVR